MIASLGSWMRGSGTSVTRTSRFPAMSAPASAAPVVGNSEVAPCPRSPAIHRLARKSFPAGRAGSVAGIPRSWKRHMKALTPLLTAGALAGAAALTARRGPDDLRGEVAVVTGASRGLGLLLARELARQGCPLVMCARDPRLDRAAGQLREAGADVTAVACDVTDEATASRLVQAALERHRPAEHRHQQRRDHPGRPGTGGLPGTLRDRTGHHGARARPPGPGGAASHARSASRPDRHHRLDRRQAERPAPAAL